MKTDIESLQDSFKIGYNTYVESRKEAKEVTDLYHNRHFTQRQKAILDERGQPKETYNIIKMYVRQLIGYYSKINTSFQAMPVQQQDTITASILTDLLKQTVYDNDFVASGNEIKIDGLLSGLFSVYINVEETSYVDQFGRNGHKVILEHVPSNQLVLDPLSIKDNYSDARFIHRFRWLSSEEVINMFGKHKIKNMEEYLNHLNETDTEFTATYVQGRFEGKYKQWDNYLIVHSIIKDDKGDSWSIYWHGDKILTKKKITYKEVKNPYRVIKLNKSNIAEYYGVFREAIEPLKAINQAIIQIQQLSNTNKVLVQTGSVKDINEFTKAFNRVNSVIEVENLAGVDIKNLGGDIQQQYMIIDNALNRVQAVLGINDSFLGNAFASDSGRKVKLQQNATTMALGYLDDRIELLYKLVGTDVANLIKQYYTANQIIGIVDEDQAIKWVEINKPLQLGNGQYVFDEDIDPASGEGKKDEFGNTIVVPVNDEDTDLQFTNFDIHIESTNYSQEDENNQIMIETMLGGAIGNALMQVNPAGFFEIASKSIKSMKTKDSNAMARILTDTANMLSPQPEMQSQLGGGGGSPKAQQQKLPQNTNVGGE